MKKFLSLLLALSMLLALAACGGGNSTADNGSGDNQGNTQQDEQPNDAGGEVESRPNQLIIGYSTKIKGELGTYAWFSNNGADYLIDRLVHGGVGNGYYTTVTNPTGEYIVNPTVVEDWNLVKHDDGTQTVTYKIVEDLQWNNGDPITAADYVAYLLVYHAPQTVEAGSWNTADSVVGAAEYMDGETNKISGVHLLGDYEFSVDIVADYATYYYIYDVISYCPLYLAKFSTDLVVKDDGDGAYLEGTLTAADVERVAYSYDSPVSCGPYILRDADIGAYTATLELNPYYKGNFEGQKPSIEKIIVTYADKTTQFDALSTGAMNLLCDQGDGEQINAGMDLVDAGGYDYATYDRNGYGYLGFICDGGPTQFIEVRHAIAYLLDRNEFCNQFTGGYGMVTHGPYGSGMWQYQECEEFLSTQLNAYNYDPAKAVAELESGGWTLDENGGAYSGTGVRWKAVTAEEAGSYQHNKTLSDGTILMPLIIEWCSSTNNSVSELLSTMLENGPQTAEAGIKINKTEMEFTEMQNYTGRKVANDPKYGGYNYGMYNMATGFSSIYDQYYYYVDSPDNIYDSYDNNKLYNKELYDLAYKMTMDTDPSDREGYLQKFEDFLKLWNELLPALPLYSNTYHSFFNDWLKNYNPDSSWPFEYAVLYAYIEGAE